MKDGRYSAVVKDYGISETQAGDPQVFIAFDVAHGEGTETLTWFGSLKEGKAQEITLKGLLAAGFTGKDVSELADGPDGGALPLGIEVSLVIENEEYEGKTRTRIRWVNKPGSGGVQRADATTAKAKLAKLGLAGKIAQVKAQNPDLVREPF
jgi:hypothetical protein